MLAALFFQKKSCPRLRKSYICENAPQKFASYPRKTCTPESRPFVVPVFPKRRSLFSCHFLKFFFTWTLALHSLHFPQHWAPPFGAVWSPLGRLPRRRNPILYYNFHNFCPLPYLLKKTLPGLRKTHICIGCPLKYTNFQCLGNAG